MIKNILFSIVESPIELANYLYARSYYGRGLRSLGPKLDDIDYSEKVVVLCNRPGEETLGLGGSLLDYKARGSDLSIIYLKEPGQAKILENYGIKKSYYHNVYSDNRGELVSSLAELVASLEPDRIYMPFLLDGDRDIAYSYNIILESILLWREDFANLWMYELNNINDLRLINRVKSLGREQSKQRQKIISLLDRKHGSYTRVFNLITRNKALIAREDAFAAETFIKMNLRAALELEDLLLNQGFVPGELGRIDSNLNFLLMRYKNRNIKTLYNNNINYVLKNKYIEGEV